VKWLQQVGDFFMTEPGAAKSKPAADYFDPALYLATIQ
jgi:NitT/TauT family transport system substrate-binding protein